MAESTSLLMRQARKGLEGSNPSPSAMLYKEFLHTLDECPFCSDKNRILMDGTHAYLTYALAPYHKHHLLVLPKRHVESVKDLNEAEREEIDRLQKEGLRILRCLNYESISLLVREGPVNVNKSIRHTHYHVIPKIQIGDLDHYGQERRILEKNEIEEMADEIETIIKGT